MKVKVIFIQDQNYNGSVIAAGTPVIMDEADLKLYAGQAYQVEKIEEKKQMKEAPNGK